MIPPLNSRLCCLVVKAMCQSHKKEIRSGGGEKTLRSKYRLGPVAQMTAALGLACLARALARKCEAEGHERQGGGWRCSKFGVWRLWI